MIHKGLQTFGGGLRESLVQMTHEQFLGQVRALARAQFPAEPDIDDFVQEAATEALASGVPPERLLDAASAHLRELRTRRHWESRRIPQVPLEEKHEASAPLTTMRRRQSRKRRPAGVLGASTMRGVAMVTLDVSEKPTVEVQLAAHILATVDLLRVAYGEPYNSEVREHILALHAKLYGVTSPLHHWAAVLLDEVEAAKLQLLKSRDPHRNKPGAATPSATFTPKRPQPGQDKHMPMQLEADAHETLPGRGVINYFGMVNGERAHVGTIVGTFGPGFPYPEDPIERSHVILMNTRLRLSSMEGPLQLPAFVDDPLLVRWLFVRAGFAGGGGPDAVKRSTLLNWLQNPEELASQVAAYARRRTPNEEQASDDEAAQEPSLEQELTELAARIRARRD
jgi:hypothetical protein